MIYVEQRATLMGLRISEAVGETAVRNKGVRAGSQGKNKDQSGGGS